MIKIWSREYLKRIRHQTGALNQSMNLDLNLNLLKITFSYQKK